MEKGSKLIIIALALFLLISIVFAIQVNSSKQGMVNKYRKMETVLSEKNSSLESQLDKVDQERRRIEGRLGSIQDEINKIASDRDEWKKRYENVKKEKDHCLKVFIICRKAEDAAVGFIHNCAMGEVKTLTAEGRLE